LDAPHFDPHLIRVTSIFKKPYKTGTELEENACNRQLQIEREEQPRQQRLEQTRVERYSIAARRSSTNGFGGILINPFACTATAVEHDARSIPTFLGAHRKDDADADVDNLL
jgi:hypothetical protein